MLFNNLLLLFVFVFVSLFSFVFLVCCFFFHSLSSVFERLLLVIPLLDLVNDNDTSVTRARYNTKQYVVPIH